MLRSRANNRRPVTGLLIIGTLILVAACGAAGPSPAPASPVPSAPAPASPQPSGGPATEAPGNGSIKLDTFDDSDVVIVVGDESGKVVAARTGTAKDGMSVRWFDSLVENVDADTLRVTWVGLPVDVEIALGVHANGSGYELEFVQPGPPKDSDAMGFDRVLEIDFAAPVDAGDVTATFTEA